MQHDIGKFFLHLHSFPLTLALFEWVPWERQRPHSRHTIAPWYLPLAHLSTTDRTPTTTRTPSSSSTNTTTIIIIFKIQSPAIIPKAPVFARLRNGSVPSGFCCTDSHKDGGSEREEERKRRRRRNKEQLQDHPLTHHVVRMMWVLKLQQVRWVRLPMERV